MHKEVGSNDTMKRNHRKKLERKQAQEKEVRQPRSGRLVLLAHLLAIALLPVFIYGNTLSAPFTFDDQPYIVKAPAVKNLRYFYEPHLAELAIRSHRLDVNFQTRTVAVLSFALNYAVHGLHPAGFRAVNIAIHILNGMLVYWLVLLTFRTPFAREAGGAALRPGTVAFLAAMLFVSHPIQTQAVTYISQRFASLATFFCLVSLTAYIKARLAVPPAAVDLAAPAQPQSFRQGFLLPYGISLVAAVLAMKTKEIAFFLPVVIALYDYCFLSGDHRRRLFVLLPLFLTMLIIPITVLGSKESFSDISRLAGSIEATDGEHAWRTYLYTQFRVIVTYLRLLVLPVNQNLDYDYPKATSLVQVDVLLSLLVLGGIALGGIGAYRRARVRRDVPASLWYMLIAFGTAWFFLFLAVESSILPLKDVIFEHRLYLPSIGVFLCVMAAAGLLGSRRGGSWPMRIAWGLAALIVIWSGASHARNALWTDELRLWTDAASKSPNKARPRLNLAYIHSQNGRYDDAVREYKLALLLEPKNLVLYKNLGKVYIEKNDLEAARDILEQGRAIDDGDGPLHIDLGVLYDAMGRPKDAEREYLRAIAIQDVAAARSNLAVALFKQKRYQEAFVHISEAVKLEPDNADYRFNLGNAYALLGNFTKAVECYEQVLVEDPGNAKARAFLSDARQKARNRDDLGRGER
jgi:tetratricopeptide (TPR) repeat protein